MSNLIMVDAPVFEELASHEPDRTLDPTQLVRLQMEFRWQLQSGM